MILLIIIGLLLFVLLWLLVMPLTLRVDTWRQDYSLRWQGVGRVALLVHDDELVVWVRIGWWQKDFFPLRPSTRKPKPIQQPKLRTKARRSWRQLPWRKVRNILRSFRVRHFRLELDTDDYVWNAFLYPLFYFVNRPGRQLSVNFEGRTNLQLEVENRLIRMLWAFLW